MKKTGLLFLAISAGLSPVFAQIPSQDGLWIDPFPLPLIAIHSAMLPSGKVLLFSAEHGVPGIHGWLLDPSLIPAPGIPIDPGTIGLTNVPPPAGWNPDWAGHSFQPDDGASDRSFDMPLRSEPHFR